MRASYIYWECAEQRQSDVAFEHQGASEFAQGESRIPPSSADADPSEQIAWLRGWDTAATVGNPAGENK